MIQSRLVLKIADIVIVFRSRFPIQPYNEEQSHLGMGRFSAFLYRGRQAPKITILVEVSAKLPEISSKKTMFVTRHPQDNLENWRLLRRQDGFVYVSPLEGKKMVAFLDRDFSRARVILEPIGKDVPEWNPLDVIYDFLQILLLNYLARRGQGIFLHASGVREAAGECLLFLGRSGRGKSTIARLWNRHTRDIILNDDRVILIKKKNRFFAYSSPWHGEFYDYLDGGSTHGPVRMVFFLDHGRRHRVHLFRTAEGFRKLYPCVFAPFWDKALLSRAADLCQELTVRTPMARLIFVNRKNVISFVRRWLEKKQ